MQKTILILFLFLFSFGTAQERQKIEIHGHRGFRGLYPENTLTAFKEGAKAGADYIELDVIISKDSQVVVSHDPWFNPNICTNPDGIAVKKSTKGNLHQLTYSEIKKYDCGKRGNKKFPQQAKLPEYKPLLSEVIETMEQYTKENNLAPLKYNIEIKSNAFGDGKYHFDPKITAKLVYNVIKTYLLEKQGQTDNVYNRILIQSFDIRSLKATHQLDTQLKIGLLIANFTSVKLNIKKLGFTPYAYNPLSKICKAKTVQQAHEAGCKVIVWTVNSEKDMKRLIRLGADGLITDYPNLAIKLR